ncbi:MAG: acetyltransferase RfbO, CysE/LacA/LpxA/NodL family, partial [Thermoleophilia bacterium]|nr:acetyltransferase RfbO, CysE/LacA/LpxA/NodL family [Thermoleophilia bacterium]
MGAAPLGRAELLELGIASCGEDVAVDPTVRIIGAERIHLGSHVRIDAFTVLSAGAGGIHIGDYVHIAAFVFLAGAGRITVGDHVGLSGRVSVYSSNDDYSGAALSNPTAPIDLRNVTTADVTFGRHVLVGAGTVVLPGVTVADGASVGALSLVTRDVDPFTIVAGIPTRVLGE